MTVTEKEFDRKITELHNLNSKIRKLGKDLENELNRKTSDAKGSKEKAKSYLMNLLTTNKSEIVSRGKSSIISTETPAAKREVLKERCPR